MSKTRVAIFASIASCAALALLAMPSQAAPFDVLIKISNAGGNWSIKIVDPSGNSDHKGPDICRTGVSLPVCQGDELTWKVIGHNLATGEQVIIRQAATAHYNCFGAASWTINSLSKNQAVGSGPISCSVSDAVSKYGVLWPYDVEFYLPGLVPGKDKPTAKVDPRGIVH